MDRTMDLVAPTAHTDHLIHRMLSILPQSTEVSSDVGINMKKIYKKVETEQHELLKGRLFEPESHELLASLISLSYKDALIFLRKKLVDVVTEEDIPVNVSSMMRGAVNTKQLQSFINVFTENEKLIYKYPELIQFIEAALLTLEESKTVFWDQLLSTEKVIQLNGMAENTESIAQQLTDMLLHPIPGSQAHYPVKIVLQLAVFAYSLCGAQSSNSWEDEVHFKEALVTALIERPQGEYTLDWLGADLNARLQEHYAVSDKSSEQYVSNEKALRMELGDKIEELEIIERLHSFRVYRQRLEDYNSLLVKKGAACQYKSQIGQILEHIYSEKSSLHDLELIQDSLSGLLRSGLGRFGLKSKPHPANHSLIILYFLGGVTVPELKEIKDKCKGKKQKVIVVSNSICNASDIYDNIFY